MVEKYKVLQKTMTILSFYFEAKLLLKKYLCNEIVYSRLAYE